LRNRKKTGGRTAPKKAPWGEKDPSSRIVSAPSQSACNRQLTLFALEKKIRTALMGPEEDPRKKKKGKLGKRTI